MALTGPKLGTLRSGLPCVSLGKTRSFLSSPARSWSHRGAASETARGSHTGWERPECVLMQGRHGKKELTVPAQAVQGCASPPPEVEGKGSFSSLTKTPCSVKGEVRQLRCGRIGVPGQDEKDCFGGQRSEWVLTLPVSLQRGVSSDGRACFQGDRICNVHLLQH